MNNNRRKFLQSTSLLAAGYLLARPAKAVVGASANSFLNSHFNLNRVEILHTGNLHGKINPFAFGGLDNVGGLHNIHSVIKNNTGSPLLVDAGGFLNSNHTASNHVSMIGQMNKTGYTAVTIGDSELAKGEAYLASLIPHMNFTLVNCNYYFSNTELKDKVKPYLVVRYGQYKIGVTGVGPILSNVACSHPVKKANEVAAYLKGQLNCDLVICLSQLGADPKNNGLNNRDFASASENIDVIVASPGENVSRPQLIVKNSKKEQVVVSTGGYGGTILGTVSFGFNKDRALETFNCKNFVPGADGTSFYDNYIKLTA